MRGRSCMSVMRVRSCDLPTSAMRGRSCMSVMRVRSCDLPTSAMRVRSCDLGCNEG